MQYESLKIIIVSNQQPDTEREKGVIFLVKWDSIPVIFVADRAVAYPL
jgi:hypothetical protein